MVFKKGDKGYWAGKKHPMTQATKDKISESNKGRKRTAKQNQRASESHMGQHCFWKGKKLSEQHKRRVGDANRGKKHGPMSDAHKLMISIGNYDPSEETRQKMRDAWVRRKARVKKGGF